MAKTVAAPAPAESPPDDTLTGTRTSAEPPPDETTLESITIELPEDDAPLAAAPPPPKKPPKIVDPEEGLEKLKQQLDGEKRAREEEQRRRQQAEADAAAARQSESKARGEVQDTNLNLVKTAIASVQQSLDVGEANYAAAMAANDYATAAKLQREMAQNAAKLQKLEDGKAELERPRPPAAPERADPVEAFAKQLAPAAASWIRSHPECITNPRMNAKMMSAHYDALADGLNEGTPQYFEAIEARLYPAESHEEPPRRAEPVRGRTNAAPPSAPVSRSNGAGRPRTATLTPQEREIASYMGMTDQEYAMNREALRKEGKLN